MNETAKGFVPEIGQLFFHRRIDAFDCPIFVSCGLLYLAQDLERVIWNITQKEYEAPIVNNGGEYINNVFEMRAYYWGDCTCGYEQAEIEWDHNNKHEEKCYQQDYLRISQLIEDKDALRAVYEKHGFSTEGENWWHGCAVRCNCSYDERWASFLVHHSHAKDCPIELPNFKCGDFEIRWYKRMGRGMSMNKPLNANEFFKIIDRCIKSLRDLERCKVKELFGESDKA